MGTPTSLNELVEKLGRKRRPSPAETIVLEAEELTTRISMGGLLGVCFDYTPEKAKFTAYALKEVGADELLKLLVEALARYEATPEPETEVGCRLLESALEPLNVRAVPLLDDADRRTTEYAVRAGLLAVQG